MYSIYIIKSGKTPFYVGMSKDLKRRFKNHLWQAKYTKRKLPVLYKIRKLLRLGKRITFKVIESGISESSVDDREIYWISHYRSKYKLYNATDGGRQRFPKQALIASRKSRLGSKRSLETRKRISEGRMGMKFTKEHRKNMSIANKNKVISREARLKASKTSTGRINIKKYILTDPSGIEYTTTHGLTQFCKKHGLYVGNFCKVLNGQRKHQKGWTIRKCNHTS